MSDKNVPSGINYLSYLMSLFQNRSFHLIVAFTMIYIVWGSTYLAIAFTVQTIPPFFAIGSRFVVAGLLLFAFLKLKGVESPTFNQVVNASLVGMLTLGVGTGLVAWAEQYIASGMAALLVTSVPFWMVLLDWTMLKGEAPNRFVIAGLVLGMGGIVLLVGPEVAQGIRSLNGLAVMAVVFASVSWSVGSLRSKMMAMPVNLFMSSAVQMLAGGVAVTILSLVAGESSRFSFAGLSTDSLIGWWYLVVFGSLGGFSSYVWLLRNAPPKQIASYAFVNPVVAVILGAWLANETVLPRMVIAIVVLVVSVALIVVFGKAKKVRVIELKTTAKAEF